MNFKQLSGFLKVVELGSFTRAAAALNTAQSALSRQIMQLEEELGVALLTRLDRGVIPTEAGKILQDQVGNVLEQIRDLKDLLHAQGGQPRGSLSVGFPPSLFDLITMPLLKDYRSRYEHVLVQVTEGISGDLLERVLSGRLDAAIVSAAEMLEGLEAIPIASEPMSLVGPYAERAKLGKRVSFDRLAKLPLIVTTKPNTLRTTTDAALAKRGLKQEIALEVNTSRIALEMSASGFGWSVLPSSAVLLPQRQKRISAAPITGLRVNWALVYARGRAMSLAMQKLRELLLHYIHETVQSGAWPGARLGNG